MQARKRKYLLALVMSAVCMTASLSPKAQCSICTRTAQQMGEKPAKGLNAGILYLAVTPLALFGGIGFWWWKKNHSHESGDLG